MGEGKCWTDLSFYKDLKASKLSKSLSETSKTYNFTLDYMISTDYYKNFKY